ncbi:DUF924 family protein [Maricaulis sp.]|uniref:DUF924 family protein n=1 Tax=Maricaulis sp. TaxID=1486257 RepID=UPI003A94B27C
MTAPRITPADVRRFWFEESGPAKWYRVSPAFDARMRRLFAASVECEAAVLRAGAHPWLDDPQDALALVILLDQFPRNIWRGSGKAFAFDALARQVARSMIERGFDFAIAEDRRAFVYMPFMHSEALDDQDYCVQLAAERLISQGTHEHAVKHREVIRRFGRFPYRNDALQRISTPEEIDYLEHGGYAPGRIDSAKKT